MNEYNTMKPRVLIISDYAACVTFSEIYSVPFLDAKLELPAEFYRINTANACLATAHETIAHADIVLYHDEWLMLNADFWNRLTRTFDERDVVVLKFRTNPAYLVKDAKYVHREILEWTLQRAYDNHTRVPAESNARLIPVWGPTTPALTPVHTQTSVRDTIDMIRARGLFDFATSITVAGDHIKIAF